MVFVIFAISSLLLLLLLWLVFFFFFEFFKFFKFFNFFKLFDYNKVLSRAKIVLLILPKKNVMTVYYMDVVWCPHVDLWLDQICRCFLTISKIPILFFFFCESVFITLQNSNIDTTIFIWFSRLFSIDLFLVILFVIDGLCEMMVFFFLFWLFHNSLFFFFSHFVIIVVALVLSSHRNPYQICWSVRKWCVVVAIV